MSTQKQLNIVAWMSRRGLLLVVVLTVSLISGSAAAVVAADEKAIPFEASASGTFAPRDTADPQFFTVTDGGAGSADGFGAFTYHRLVMENSTVVPAWCDTGIGSTAVHGSAVIVFADGGLFLEQKSGESCVYLGTFPPTVRFVTDNKIKGGTGRFEQADGKLTIEVTGNLLDGTLEGTFSGSVKIHGEH